MNKVIITEEQYKKLMALNEEFPPTESGEENKEETTNDSSLAADLIDGVITSFKVLQTMDLSEPDAQEALKDLVDQDLVTQVTNNIHDKGDEPDDYNVNQDNSEETSEKNHDSAGSWIEPKAETSDEPEEDKDDEKTNMFENIERTFGNLEVRNLILENSEIKGEVKSSYGVWGTMKWDEQGVVKGIDNPFKKLTYKLPLS